MATGSQQFPNLNAPIVTEDRVLAQEWRTFFQTIWARTGSAIGSAEVKTGVIIGWAGTEAPEGYLLCQGQEVLKTSYPNLFKLIGNSYGTGSSPLVFKLPNGQGKSLFGAGSGLFFGTTGGEATHQITLAELPTHSHTFNELAHTHDFISDPHTHTITDPGHDHTAGVSASTLTAGAAAGSLAAGNTGSSMTDITIDDATVTGTTDSANTSGALSNAGESSPMPLLPPYFVANWIIKT